MDVPFVLTVAVEENAFEFFNALRKIYFPGSNEMDAHLTLFHLLPSELSIIETIETLSQETSPLLLHVRKPFFTGSGVAYEIECPDLVQMHEQLRREWNSFLIPQDQENFLPQITIQDEASPTEAQELLEFLKENFSTFYMQGTGLQLWQYDNGSHKLFREFRFSKD